MDNEARPNQFVHNAPCPEPTCRRSDLAASKAPMPSAFMRMWK